MADCANITRRNAFKALAVLPALAGAVAGAKFGLDALLDNYAAARAENDAAGAAVEAAMKFPGQPAWPHVARSDFTSRMQWHVPNKTFFSVEEIEAVFDQINGTIEFNRSFNTSGVVERWKADAEQELSLVMGIFHDRRRAYEDWADRSGLTASQKAEDAAAAKLRAIDGAILDYRPQSIEEVRAKATFIEREWLTDQDESYVVRVIKSLAPLPFEA